MTILSVFANSYAADGALGGWTNPQDVYSDNSVYATRSGTTKNVVYGNLLGFDLSALPDNATINSVTIEAQWHTLQNDTAGPVLTLGAQSGGVLVGSVNDTVGQTTDHLHTYSPTGLTAAQLKATGASGFWAVMRFKRIDNTTHMAYVDYVKVTVDYTAGGTAYTLTGQTGSFALNGNTAGMKAARKLSAQTAAFTLTGNSATLTKGAAVNHYTLTAQSGSFAVTGNSAALKVGRKLIGTVRSFSMTGRPAGLRIARKLSALSGAFSLVGNVANLVLQGAAQHLTLTAQTATFGMTSSAATMRVGRRLTGATRSFSLIGMAAGLRTARRLRGLVGAFVMTGASAVIEKLAARNNPTKKLVKVAHHERMIQTQSTGVIESKREHITERGSTNVSTD